MDFTEKIRLNRVIRHDIVSILQSARLRGAVVSAEYVHINYFQPDEFIEVWAKLNFGNGFTVMFFDAIDPDCAVEYWQRDGWQKWQRFVVGQVAVNEMQNAMLARWECWQ